MKRFVFQSLTWLIVLSCGFYFWYHIKGGKEKLEPVLSKFTETTGVDFNSLFSRVPKPPTPKVKPVEADTSRTWTDLRGRTLQGQLIIHDGSEALIRVLPAERVYRIALTNLIQSDRDYILARNRNASWEMPPQTTQAGWPAAYDGRYLAAGTNLDADKTANDIKGFQIHGGGCSQEDLNRMAGICLAIDQAIKSLPLPLTWGRPENSRRKVLLYNSTAMYNKSGALPGSAGIYEIASGNVRVCMPALMGMDLRKKLGQYQLGERKKYSVLVHELVHQATPAFSNGRVPAWIPEGIAEYFAATQSTPGQFEFRNSQRLIREYISDSFSDTDGLIQVKTLRLWNLEDFFDRYLYQWNTINVESEYGIVQYAQALILVEFFGQNDGNSLRPYLEAIVTGADPEQALRTHLLRNQTYQQLQQRIAQTWQPRGLEIVFEKEVEYTGDEFQLDVGLKSRLR